METNVRWLRGLCRAVCGCLLAIALGGCSSNGGKIRIAGEVENLGTSNLRVVYLTRGAIQSVTAPAVNGSFEMEGSMTQPSVVRIYTSSGQLLGSMAVSPGEKIKLKLNATDRTFMDVKGSGETDKIARFLHGNSKLIRSGHTAKVNEAIAGFVAANRKSLAAGVLLSDWFTREGNEQQLAALIESLDGKVIVGADLEPLQTQLATLTTDVSELTLGEMRLVGDADTFATFTPATTGRTLVILGDADSRGSDSVRMMLKKLMPEIKDKRLTVADISCDADNAAWHEAMAGRNETDSLPNGIRSFWTLDGPTIPAMMAIGVGRIPWFITADSTARVLYRGGSVEKALKSLEPDETAKAD